MGLVNLSVIALLSPLVAAILVGFVGRILPASSGRPFAHFVACGSVLLSLLISAWLCYQLNVKGLDVFEVQLYQWLKVGSYHFEVGLLIDSLSSTMMVVVTFVSLMVHIYTIGYMDHDEDYEHSNPYYQRFFSYIALFTFAMLSLVMANNFMQLFFGWEAVGLVSYLLIGFYLKRQSAVKASLKAFLVNRIADIGFLLGIAGVLMFFDSLNYAEVFQQLSGKAQYLQINITEDIQWQAVTVISVLLFIGAMGKSAQMPLHVWLPESMEGPTPISALIHAATMVTAGIFMVVRLSPLYELSESALSMILIVGASTAFFTGLIGIVQNDIKRVVAYSTLSQLGYMVAALGASAYIAGFFHVVTHAFFKALLFLGAGSVIVALHHQQNIRQMGGLRQRMPITYICMLIGSLSLIGTPGFSGFFSKESIILAIGHSTIFGSGYAGILLLLGVFVTAFYSFRMFFIVFHAPPSEFVIKHQPTESPKTITLPLIALAIPSVIIGFLLMDSWLFGDYFSNAIVVNYAHQVALDEIKQQYQSSFGLLWHSPLSLPFYLAVFGVVSAWYLYVKQPHLTAILRERFQKVYKTLVKGYGFDDFNQLVLVKNSVRLGRLLWQKMDIGIVDYSIAVLPVRLVQHCGILLRNTQTGWVYHYVFALIVGVVILLMWLLFRVFS